MRAAYVAAFALLAACSPAAEQNTDAAETAQRVVCAELALIGPGQDHCGIGLTADAVVTLDGTPTQNGAPFIVTSGVERRAASLMVYPTPQGRFVYVRGCEGGPAEPGICWASRILDRDTGEMRDITLRSHYGPARDIHWSPDGERFALVEPMEGFEALTLVNPLTGVSRSYPPEGGAHNWRIDDASIAWTSNTMLTANVELCDGDSGACAPAAPQTLAID